MPPLKKKSDGAMVGLGYDNLTGPQKAAVFVLSLEEDSAAEVLKHLEPNEVQRLTQHASRLRHVPTEAITAVQNEFVETSSSSTPMIGGQTKDHMIKLIYKTFPKDTADELAEYLESGEEILEGLDALRFLDGPSIASFIRSEYPQTQAIVLAYLDPALSGEVLSLLPERVRSEIIMRLATLDRVNPVILKELDDVIKAEMLASGAAKNTLIGGVECAAEIMNYLDKATETAILSQVEESNPTLVEEIRELMFVFEDLSGLDDRGMQAVMKEISNDILTLALKTASVDLKGKMLRNISQRAGQMIQEELDLMGPVKLTDVEHAQQEIVKIARRLEEEGKIVLSGKGGGETLV